MFEYKKKKSRLIFHELNSTNEIILKMLIISFQVKYSHNFVLIIFFNKSIVYELTSFLFVLRNF